LSTKTPRKAKTKELQRSMRLSSEFKQKQTPSN